MWAEKPPPAAGFLFHSMLGLIIRATKCLRAGYFTAQVLKAPTFELLVLFFKCQLLCKLCTSLIFNHTVQYEKQWRRRRNVVLLIMLRQWWSLTELVIPVCTRDNTTFLYFRVLRKHMGQEYYATVKHLYWQTDKIYKLAHIQCADFTFHPHEKNRIE